MADLASEKQFKNSSLMASLFWEMRPVHWIKNLAIFAAAFLTGVLFDKGQLSIVLTAFAAFCAASSAAYIVNDILDLNSDRLHPTKKERPIASGRIPINIAAGTAIALALISVFLASQINSLFLFISIAYLLLQFLYSLVLKNLAIMDILTIASGFVIRVYAGAFAINAHLSVWFLLCVISVALFLASGKRRAELNLVENTNVLTRKSLRSYKKELLTSYVTMFGNASWMSWALYTFFESPKATLPVWLVLAELSKTTTINKLLMLTIPIAIFGIMRYESLIFEGKSETPERLLLTDRALIAGAFIWALVVYWVLYSGVSIF